MDRTSDYEVGSWQKENTMEQNKGYGIPRVKRGPEQAQVANKQEPAGGPSGDGYV